MRSEGAFDGSIEIQAGTSPGFVRGVDMLFPSDGRKEGVL